MAEQYTAKTIEDLIPRAQVLAISGLEFMQGAMNGTVPGSPISDDLNYQLHLVEDGRVVFHGTPEFRHCNPVGAVHGGWYGTLLDSCMACAIMTRVPKGATYTTLEYKINITRPVPLGTLVAAEGLVQHAGRSTGVANGEIRGVDDGKLYATGSTTCIIMKA